MYNVDNCTLNKIEIYVGNMCIYYRKYKYIYKMEEWYTVTGRCPDKPDGILDIRCMSLYNGYYDYEDVNITTTNLDIVILHILDDNNTQRDHLRNVFKIVGDITTIDIRFSTSTNEYYAIISFQTITYNRFVEKLLCMIDNKNREKHLVSCCMVYTKWQHNIDGKELQDDMVDTFITHYKEHHVKIQEIEIYDVYLLDIKTQENFDIYTYAANYAVVKRLYNALIRHTKTLQKRLEQTVNEEPLDYYGDGEDMHYIL